MHVYNSEQHIGTGVIIEPFGSDGSIHLTPTRPGLNDRSFILDAPAARLLASAIFGLQPEDEPDAAPDFEPSPDPDWMNP